MTFLAKIAEIDPTTAGVRCCPHCGTAVVYRGEGPSPLCDLCRERRRVEKNAARRVVKDPVMREEKVALGACSGGLDYPCAYCLPALVTAHTYRGGLPCCHECAANTSKPRVPSFVLVRGLG